MSLSLPSEPRPRVRHRQQLRDFESFLGAPNSNAAGWIDRLKYSIGGLALSVPCGADDLTAYLRRRCTQQGDTFAVETPPGRVLHVVFSPARWLFKLTLIFWFSDGVWRGNGALETNTTRLYGAIGEFHDFASDVYVPTLLQRPPPSTRNPFGTLDGKDNFVPTALLLNAMRTDWCALTGAYLEAVIATVNTALGTAFDFEASSGLHQPLVRLPNPNQWTLKEAEVYSECRDENAPLRIASLGEIARRMSSNFVQTNYGASAILSEHRVANAPSLRIGLGAEGVHLSAYAKAFDRMRFEVRYTAYPMSACGLTVADFSSQPDGAVQALRGVRSNALRRLRRFLSAYQEHGLDREPTLTCLTRALSIAAHAPPRTPITLYRVLSLLIVHGGISRANADADTRLLIDRLIEADVLRPSRMTQKSRHDYVLGPTYAASFGRLRDISRY